MTRTNNSLIVKRSYAGLGLFTLKPIAADKRIIESVGVLLTDEEAKKAGGKYLYDLGNKLTLDGSSRSNIARYINHSCNPNARAYITRNRVWIWSLRPIEAGEEITTDYGKEYFDEYIKPKGCKCAACAPKKAS
jgi:SET domain-containing protein